MAAVRDRLRRTLFHAAWLYLGAAVGCSEPELPPAPPVQQEAAEDSRADVNPAEREVTAETGSAGESPFEPIPRGADEESAPAGDEPPEEAETTEPHEDGLSAESAPRGGLFGLFGKSEGGSAGGPGGGVESDDSAVPATPQTAARTARAALQEAAVAADDEDFAAAYELAMQGWQAAAVFIEDAACAELASQLETRAEAYLRKLGRRPPAHLRPADDDPLIVR